MFRKSSLFVNIFRWTGSFIYFRSRPWCFEVVVFFVQPMKAWMCVWSAQSSWLCVCGLLPLCDEVQMRAVVPYARHQRAEELPRREGRMERCVDHDHGRRWMWHDAQIIDALLLVQDMFAPFVWAVTQMLRIFRDPAPSFASVSQLKSFLGYVDRKTSARSLAVML